MVNQNEEAAAATQQRVVSMVLGDNDDTKPKDKQQQKVVSVVLSSDTRKDQDSKGSKKQDTATSSVVVGDKTVSVGVGAVASNTNPNRGSTTINKAYLDDPEPAKGMVFEQQQDDTSPPAGPEATSLRRSQAVGGSAQAGAYPVPGIEGQENATNGTGSSSSPPQAAMEEGIATARPVADQDVPSQRAEPFAGSHHPNLTPEEMHNKKMGRGLLILAAVVAVALIIVLGVVLGTKKDDDNPTPPPTPSPTPPPTPSPTQDPFTTILNIVDLPHDTIESILDYNSSQALAWEWFIRDPNLSNYSQSKKVQRFALATFYQSLVGEDWDLQDGWMDWNLDECDWFHRELVDIDTNVWAMRRQSRQDSTKTNATSLVCNDEGQYLYLVFTKNNLHGSIPPEIGLLTELRLLDLSNNWDPDERVGLGGPIPTEIGKLSQLRRFNVARNGHENLVPTELGLLTRLEQLYLEHNEGIQGEIPSQIGNIQTLKILSLGRSGFTGFLPTELYRLTNLEEYLVQNVVGLTGGSLEGMHQMTAIKKMVVHDVPYKQVIPSQIGLLTTLDTLNVWNTQLSGSVPTEFWQLTNLYRLDIDDCLVTGTFPTEVEALSHLNAAWMNGNQWTGTIPTNIWHNFYQIKVLALNNNLLTGPIPTEVGLLNTSWPDLQLRFNSQPLTGTIPTEFGIIPSLQKIFLHETELTGTIPEELVNLDILQDITVSQTGLTGSIPEELCDQVKEMRFECVVVLGVEEQLCTNAKMFDFNCTDSLLCGCTCDPCEQPFGDGNLTG